MTPVADALSTIVVLEGRLDRALPAVRLEGRLTPAIIDAERAWSEAVWHEATRLGPAVLGPDERAKAREIARRPVFVCGAHRSGTTLVRDLLDGHPALAVLPAEGSFFTNLHAQIARLDSAAARARFAGIWLRRIANPINQPPYWLLGRSNPNTSPYVDVARVLLTVWQDFEATLGARASSWPTAAVALAYAYTLGGGVFDLRLSRWVEKTPTNEQYLDCLWTEFPDALVIHVVRDPLSVVASRKLLEQRATGGFTNLGAVLRDLTRSYRIARDRVRQGEQTRYLLLRYEEVTRDPDTTADRLAAFLGIERLAGLCCPTVAGTPSPNNTSYTPASVRGQVAPARDRGVDTLTPHERDSVTAVAGPLATSLGYVLPPLSSWRRRMLTWKARFTA